MATVFLVQASSVEYTSDTNSGSATWTSGLPEEQGTNAAVEPTFIQTGNGTIGQTIDITDTSTTSGSRLDENTDTDVANQTFVDPVSGDTLFIWVDYSFEVTDPVTNEVFTVWAVSSSNVADNTPNDTGQIGYVSEQPMYPDRIYTVTPGSNSSAHNTVEPNYTDLTPFCFCKGTLIKTHDGERPVEEIDIGDLVWTLDKGMQPVSRVGKTIAKGGIARRVLIKKGALRNKRDLPPFAIV